MANIKEKNRKEERRRIRNKAKIFGTATKPRLSVFRSNKYTYAQLIDDGTGKTIASASTIEFSKNKAKKADTAKSLGASLAEKAKSLNIKEAVFNKGPYLYHGRVKAVADGAREGGLKI
ncbi:MAG: 50S ribosomal protein L18 [Patescibacteria group bacterium]|nr:50S ribosomal protein L18 [Patescibacteria group bacterium]